jgi:hypothetical protein
MTKLNLALINSDGRGRPVPPEMDLHIIKFVVGNRKQATQSDPKLIQTDPWDHSDVFYAARTWLNQHNWDTSVYNDSAKSGSKRRKTFYDKIKGVCEDTYHVKRHQIGIFPEERALMSYRGRTYAVGFDELNTLVHLGTDVIAVEKQGTVLKMEPFTKDNGVAFIQSQGFISEYGIALAQLTTAQTQVTKDYLNSDDAVTMPGHLGNLMDCDSSGFLIGIQVKGAVRLGINLETIDEINHVNKGLGDKLGIKLPITLADVQETTTINYHWKSLRGIIDGKGNAYKSLSDNEKIYYRKYLLSKPRILGGKTTLLDYLKENRIELNTILALIKPQAFWNWLRWKLLKTWPSRNYYWRGGLELEDDIRTPTMNRFIDFYGKYTKSITEPSLKNQRHALTKVEYMYDDMDGFQDNIKTINKAIMGDVMNDIVLQDDKVKKLDLALEKIMKNGNNNKKSKSQEAVDTKDDGSDGNEFDE